MTNAIDYAAIISAVITGGFGLLGIFLTQRYAQRKIKRIQEATDLREVVAPRQSNFNSLQGEISHLKSLLTEKTSDIREGVADNRLVSKEVLMVVKDLDRKVDQLLRILD